MGCLVWIPRTASFIRLDCLTIENREQCTPLFTNDERADRSRASLACKGNNGKIEKIDQTVTKTDEREPARAPHYSVEWVESEMSQTVDPKKSPDVAINVRLKS